MNGVLEEMFRSGVVNGEDGLAREFHSSISSRQAVSLERVCRAERPTTTLEVGLAYGTSALAILEGKDRSDGVHLAIDPFQSSQWASIGLGNVQRAGFGDRFMLVEERDDRVLPRLVDERFGVELAFIDGDHSLQATLLDWHYIDQLLLPGGILVFHDYPMAGVYQTVAIAIASGRYERVTVWDTPRPPARRIAKAATQLVRSRDLAETIAAGAADTQMPMLRKLV